MSRNLRTEAESVLAIAKALLETRGYLVPIFMIISPRRPILVRPDFSCREAKDASFRTVASLAAKNDAGLVILVCESVITSLAVDSTAGIDLDSVDMSRADRHDVISVEVVTLFESFAAVQVFHKDGDRIVFDGEPKYMEGDESSRSKLQDELTMAFYAARPAQ